MLHWQPAKCCIFQLFIIIRYLAIKVLLLILLLFFGQQEGHRVCKKFSHHQFCKVNKCSLSADPVPNLIDPWVESSERKTIEICPEHYAGVSSRKIAGLSDEQTDNVATTRTEENAPRSRLQWNATIYCIYSVLAKELLWLSDYGPQCWIFAEQI